MVDVDITVFKMEVDDQTFNAPFSGRARSDGAASTDDSSDVFPVKLVVGLCVVLLLSLGALVFILKRRFRSSDNETEDEEDETIEVEIEADRDESVVEDEERGGIASIIGLSFLVVTAALVKRVVWNVR